MILTAALPLAVQPTHHPSPSLSLLRCLSLYLFQLLCFNRVQSFRGLALQINKVNCKFVANINKPSEQEPSCELELVLELSL